MQAKRGKKKEKLKPELTQRKWEGGRDNVLSYHLNREELGKGGVWELSGHKAM